MNKKLPHTIPDIEKWPITWLSKNRDQFIIELNEYTYQKVLTDGIKQQNLEELLASTIYLEKIRVKTNPWKVDPPNEMAYWQKLEAELKSNLQSDDPDNLNKKLLQKIINRYSEEIVTNFSPKTFRFARKFLSAFFKRLLNPIFARNQRAFWGNQEQLESKLIVTGAVREMRELLKQGTVIAVPTHFSNLDSILIGYMMETKVGLPSFSYGAGLNLYDSEIIAYFMSKLGAYKIDRRKTSPIYRISLNAFSSLSVQKGINTIFFPGGTRSRSGQLEKDVKWGLMSSLLDAQRQMYTDDPSKKIFVFPVVVSYHFVLEASSLIDQHLQAAGKERYFRSKIKSSGLGSTWKFIKRVFSSDSKIYMNIGKPLDVLGNKVDTRGYSHDANGNLLDIGEYYMTDGLIKADKQREAVYTRHLGRIIVDQFHKENVVLTSHIVCFAAFEYFQKLNKKDDLYTILSLSASNLEIELSIFQNWIKMIQAELIILRDKGALKLSDDVLKDELFVIHDGIRNVNSYHQTRPILLDEKEMIRSEHLETLYFYHNRLVGFDLEGCLEVL